MKDSDYYPPGAYNDPNAPYNEIDVPERSFNVCISQTLSKSTDIITDDYNPEFDEEDGYTYANTEDTDWEEAYEKAHYTPLELIEKFKELLINHLPDPVVDINKYREWKHLISECEDWEEDEIVVMEDK